jgi:hypothetical protein
MAGAVLQCENDQLTTCNAEGTATTTQACVLGCASDAARCRTFEPSNGLGPALAESANENDVILPSGTRIDTDLGVVQDADGTSISVRAIDVNQAGGLPIRVLVAGSFAMGNVTVTGTRPIAFVAGGPITVTGRLTARATGSVGGPGARTSGSCSGGDMNQLSGCATPSSVGTGGAGNHQPGGRGGANDPNGGAALTGFSPLAGGCSGGTQFNIPGTSIVARGGGGGGAVQLVSQTSVVLTEQGMVDVGGGGGQSTTGGGSGGMIVIEAPEVSLSGSSAGLVANGGAGGGCGMKGPDATVTTSPALGAVCANYFAGNGGTGSAAPGNGCISGVDNCVGTCPTIYGGGGGSVGRMRIATKTGSFATTGNPVISVAITTSVLSTK